MSDVDDLRNSLTNPTIQGRLNGTYETHGVSVAVEVSPCAWMYPLYGIQFQYRAEDGRSWGYLNEKPLAVETATREDIQRLLDANLTAEPCEMCKKTHLFNGQERDNIGARKHVCERCFIARLDAELDQHRAQERDELAKRDRKMKKKGYTHRTVAWVHPSQGGDDYMVDLYTKGKPTKAEIVGFLKRKKSARFDDYSTVAL